MGRRAKANGPSGDAAEGPDDAHRAELRRRLRDKIRSRRNGEVPSAPEASQPRPRTQRDARAAWLVRDTIAKLTSSSDLGDAVARLALEAGRADGARAIARALPSRDDSDEEEEGLPPCARTDA